MFRYAMKNPTFREVVQTKIRSVSSNTMIRKKTVARRISVRNHNRLLWNFDGAIGGKTGYTLAAQKCFVGAVQRNGVTLIVSILGSHDQWGDTRKLLEYGFDNYQTLKAGTQPAVHEVPGEQAAVRPEKIRAISMVPDEDMAQPEEGYVLQVGSFRERGRAESLSSDILAKGFKVFVEEAVLNRETSYRVRLGPYTELLQAQETARELLLEIGQRALVLPVSSSRMNDGERG